MKFWELTQLYEQDADKAQIHAAMESMGFDAVEENNRLSTLLHIAAKYVDAEMVKKLLDAGIDPNAKNSYGENPLFTLAEPYERHRLIPSADKRACADLLLDAGAGILTRSEGDGQTVLTSAGHNGQWELIESVIAHGLKLTRTNQNGENVLHCALDYARMYGGDAEKRENYFRLVKLLADNGFDMDEKDKYGRSPLEYAKDCDDKRLAALIEGNYSDGGANLTGGLSFQEAVEKEDYDAIRAIAANGADLNALADEGKWKGQTPLSVACSYLNETAVELLLSLGADPNFKNADGQSCLHSVLALGNTPHYDFSGDKAAVCKKILSLLISGGMDKDGTINDEGDTALIAACRKAGRSNLCCQFAAALISLKCALDKTNLKGQTALMLISLQSRADANELQIAVLEAGADVSVCDRDGNTALHYAAMNTDDSVAKEMAEMLFEFDFELVDAVNNEGKTALEIASDQDNEPLVKLILMNS